MSRVERNKDQYSKQDRQAVERSRAAAEQAESRTCSRSVSGNEAGSTASHAGSAPAEMQSSAKRTGAAPVEMPEPGKRKAGKKRRASAGAREQGEEYGILDMTEEEKRLARKEARAMRDGKPEFKAGRAVGRLIGAVGTIILIVAIAACLGLAVPRFAGIEQYVVISGSMEPAVPVGSMVYSAQTEPSTLETGDIIVFRTDDAGSTPVTHRVVENHVADGEVITKGDANEQNDLSPVMYSNILGKVQLHVPMLGYIAAPLATLAGKIAMGCIIIAAYLLTVAGGRMGRK